MKLVKSRTPMPKSDGILNIGLNSKNVDVNAKLLNNALSTSFKLLVKVWGYHWNMVGPSFHTNHLFFNDLYDELIKDVDDIAERIRSLSKRTLCSLAEMQQSNRIVEQSSSDSIPSIMEMMQIICNDYEQSIQELRDICSTLDKQKPTDDGNLNYLQDLIMRREKSQWFLRSFLQTQTENETV